VSETVSGSAAVSFGYDADSLLTSAGKASYVRRAATGKYSVSETVEEPPSIRGLDGVFWGPNRGEQGRKITLSPRQLRNPPRSGHSVVRLGAERGRTGEITLSPRQLRNPPRSGHSAVRLGAERGRTGAKERASKGVGA
jgi:hypothetical protein